MSSPIKVAVIDDDAPMRRALVRLIKSARIEAAAFSSAREFLPLTIPEARVLRFQGLALQNVVTIPRARETRVENQRGYGGYASSGNRRRRW
jgi:hypothetical protein